MKSDEIIINTRTGYYYFDDLLDNSKMYSITEDVNVEIKEIDKSVNFILANVPYDKMIKAYPVGITAGMKLTIIISILLLLLGIKSNSQDTLTYKNGKIIVVKVIEIDAKSIKYKLSSNLEGPVYIKEKSEIRNIKYQNGDLEEFRDQPIASGSGKYDLVQFHAITQKGNKVFIDCDISNGDIHAENYITEWGYWEPTNQVEKADFILKFVLIKSWPDYYGLAQFIDVKTNRIIYQTKKVSTEWNMDFNSKRGVIDKIIRKRIKPLYK
jgi:hypothetical protein